MYYWMSGSLTFKSVLLFLVAASTVYSQGTVNFVNHNTSVTPVIDAFVQYGGGGAMPASRADSGITVTDPVTHITYGGFRQSDLHCMVAPPAPPVGRTSSLSLLL